MEVSKILKNYSSDSTLRKQQIRSSRSVIFIALILFAFHGIEDLFNNDLTTWQTDSIYLYIKVLILLLLFVFLITSYFLESIKVLFGSMDFVFMTSIFYLLTNFIIIEGVDLQSLTLLLTVSIVSSLSSFSKYRVFLYTCFSNIVLLIAAFYLQGNQLIWPLFTIHFTTTIAMMLINLLSESTVQNSYIVQQLFEKVFNTLRDPVLLLDPKINQIVYFNEAVTKKFSNDFSGAKTSDFSNFAIGDDIPTLVNAFKLIYELKGVWEGEILFKDKSGKEFYSVVSLGFFTIDKQPFIFVKVTDVSKLKVAEKRVQETLKSIEENNIRLENSKSALVNVIDDVVTERALAQIQEQKLTAVLESIAEGVVVVNLDNKIFLNNSAALNLLGYESKEFLGKNISEVLRFVDEKTGSVEDNFIVDAFKGKVISKFANTALLTKEGKILPVIQTISPIFDDNKNVSRVVVVFNDATEQRKIEKLRQEFVSVASHQLRTPLTGIKWFVEILNDESSNGNLTEEQRQAVKTIGESNERMIRLVNDLLSVSRIESGKNMQIEYSENDLLTIINAVVEELRILGKLRQVDISFENNGIENLLLNIDPIKIRELIANLVSNAVKYSNPSSNVELKLSKDETNCYLDITDHGIGIPKTEQSRIFQKFFRAENAVKQQTEGTGLGIYISLMIARSHGGDITFVSESGQGSTFTLKLPLHFTPVVQKAEEIVEAQVVAQ